MIEHYIQLGLALLTGYFCGSGIGYRRANKEYKRSVDQACNDYREAARIITKLRTRLSARRIIEMKAKLG